MSQLINGDSPKSIVRTMDKLPGSRMTHQPILRKPSLCESEESGCKSADEGDEDEKSNPHMSLIIETSMKTVINGSRDDLQHSSASSESGFAFIDPTPRRSESISSELGSQLTSSPRNRVNSYCPGSDGKLNDSAFRRSPLSSRIQSTNSLSPRLLGARSTGDSGTGTSMTNLPNQASAAIISDGRITIYGLEDMASMPKRFLFDPSKVHAHDLRRDLKHAKPPASPNGLYNSHTKKSLISIFSSLLPTRTPSTASISPPVTPMVRHHNSRFYPDTESQ